MYIHMCVCMYVCMYVYVCVCVHTHVISVSPSVVSETLRPYGQQPARLFCPWTSPCKDTCVGSHFLVQIDR